MLSRQKCRLVRRNVRTHTKQKQHQGQRVLRCDYGHKLSKQGREKQCFHKLMSYPSRVAKQILSRVPRLLPHLDHHKPMRRDRWPHRKHLIFTLDRYHRLTKQKSRAVQKCPYRYCHLDKSWNNKKKRRMGVQI